MSRKTYEIGHRRRRNWRVAALVVLAVLLLAGGFYIYQQFKKDTQPVIKNSAGSTHAQAIPNSTTQHFDQGGFSFDAPADWQLVKHSAAPYNLYSFHSKLKNADNRALDIYVDRLPEHLAVNKAVAVRAQGNSLSHGQASDNCTTFTSSNPRTPGGSQPLSVLSKWDGVEFLCNNDNVQRNVLGTSSPGNINKVVLASPAAGTHAFFFVYTDDNATPEYSIFYNMLESFLLK